MNVQALVAASMNVPQERVADLAAKSPAEAATHAPALVAVTQSALAVLECSPHDSARDRLVMDSPFASSLQDQNAYHHDLSQPATEFADLALRNWSANSRISLPAALRHPDLSYAAPACVRLK